MKKFFILANWKSNKTIGEAEEWIKQLTTYNLPASPVSGQLTTNLEIILCPPFTILYPLKLSIEKLQLPIKLGAQDISPFPDGPYTGEVSGKMIAELAFYVLVGHSERRTYFEEKEQMIAQKIEMAISFNLTPIVCVSHLDEVKSLPCGFSGIILYEPISAIGTGEPDTPENANRMAERIKDFLGDIPIIYGGSVTSENVVSFLSQPRISGVGAGKASLDPLEFLKIVRNAAKI